MTKALVKQETRETSVVYFDVGKQGLHLTPEHWAARMKLIQLNVSDYQILKKYGVPNQSMISARVRWNALTPDQQNEVLASPYEMRPLTRPQGWSYKRLSKKPRVKPPTTLQKFQAAKQALEQVNEEEKLVKQHRGTALSQTLKQFAQVLRGMGIQHLVMDTAKGTVNFDIVAKFTESVQL